MYQYIKILYHTLLLCHVSVPQKHDVSAELSAGGGDRGSKPGFSGYSGRSGRERKFGATQEDQQAALSRCWRLVVFVGFWLMDVDG